MIHISKLTIDKPFISIWGNGNSVNRYYNADDIGVLKHETFTVFVNMLDIFNPDLRIWIDRTVTDYLEAYPPANEILVAADSAFRPSHKYKIKDRIEYTFKRSEEQYRDGNYTLFIAFMIFKKYFPDKPILIFGMDCKKDDNRSFEYNRNTREIDTCYNDKQKEHLRNLPYEFEKFVNDYPVLFEYVYNCSPDSDVWAIKKIDWKDVIKKYEKN